MAALCVLPLVVVAFTAFGTGVGAAWDLLWRPRVGELLRKDGLTLTQAVGKDAGKP